MIIPLDLLVNYIASLSELCPLFHAGSKEEIYFDLPSCLESDCEDFFSVSGGESYFQFVLEFGLIHS